jgi:predicted ATP-grasp superfamily ATP-dependent carboligase
VRLAATATTLDLAQEIGYVPGTMDVPAGAQAAIERRLFDAGIPAVGLWARVPHYVAAMPYPSASAALLDSLASLAGLAIDTSELQRAGDEALERIEVLVGQNPDHVELVRRLEAQLDSESDATRGVGFGDIPTGDEIAAELERFLRGQD